MGIPLEKCLPISVNPSIYNNKPRTLYVSNHMQRNINTISFIFLIFVSITLWNSCSSVTERRPDFDVHGIDVSHYQGNIDWETVAKQGVDFAFVKATEGLTYRDSLFCNNWDEMGNVGIPRGAYHFFRPTVSPYLQAYNFTQTVNLEIGDLPPVLDFEVVGEQHRIGIISNIQTWLSIVEEMYNIRPIIYTNQQLYRRYIQGNFDDYPIWIARYNDDLPDMPFDQTWAFWQYGNKGNIEGISGDVDFNVFHGDLEALKSMTLSSSNMVPSYSLIRKYQL